MEQAFHTYLFHLGVVGGVWMIWLTLTVLHLARRSPRVLELEVADLADRFTRWQKRENIRLARERGNLLAEAHGVLANVPPAPPPPPAIPDPDTDPAGFKQWLRRKATSIQP